MQHAGAVAPGVHDAASASEQLTGRHVPPVQVPEQQSSVTEQVCPSGWQHRPPWQIRAPQHPSEPVHAPPEPRQQRFVTGDAAQVRDSLQQFGAVAVGLQTADSPSVHGAAWQVPDTHTRPAQQPALVVQLPDIEQHRPLWQASVPQQPIAVVHAAWLAPQQRLVPTTSEQVRTPVQQPGAPLAGTHAAASASMHPAAA